MLIGKTSHGYYNTKRALQDISFAPARDLLLGACGRNGVSSKVLKGVKMKRKIGIVIRIGFAIVLFSMPFFFLLETK